MGQLWESSSACKERPEKWFGQKGAGLVKRGRDRRGGKPIPILPVSRPPSV